MRYFCTYFDKNYLPRALALHASLVRHCHEFQLFALCHDNISLDYLTYLSIPEIIPVSLLDLEKHDKELLRVKSSRSVIEYYFTCTPAICLYVMDNYCNVDLLTYLDADLYFFSSLKPLFDELGGHSIGIIGHRFAKKSKHFEKYGLYNVGWLSFQRDDNGIECLKWWRARCIDWCFDYLDGNKFADQKYLDDWPNMFRNVHVIKHKGANVAAWNLANYKVREQSGNVFIDEQPLIFFHFASFKRIRYWLYKTSFGSHMIRPSRVVKRYIFWPYISQLNKLAPMQNSAKQIRKFNIQKDYFKESVKNLLRFIRGLVFREYIFYHSDERHP